MDGLSWPKSPGIAPPSMMTDVAHQENSPPKVAGVAGLMGNNATSEVPGSHPTRALQPSNRYSISATTLHFEELAAEAGVDIDADEINVDDLRMHRLENEPAYALDDESDDDNTDYDLGEGVDVVDQKMAHKERSILQMVDVLSDRLASLNAVVVNRYNGCKSDLDETTDFRSSRTKKMQAPVPDEDWDGSTPPKAGDKGRRPIGFLQATDVVDGGHVTEPTRLTFRNAPQTDAGRRLAHQFEQAYGIKQVGVGMAGSFPRRHAVQI